MNLHQDKDLHYIRAGEVVVSTGSIERPLSFGNNDRPGIFLASAATEYMKVYGTLVGKKPIIFTNNDSAYKAAIEFNKNNIKALILDTRENSDGDLVKEAQSLGLEIKFNSGVADVKGRLKISSAILEN